MTAVLQLFHWYSPGAGTLWRSASARAQELAASGFTAVWLPPAYKGHAGGYDVGYGVYDLYDLGEFDQKGGVATKYGTKDEYLAAIRDLQAAGLTVYADIVWGHRLGADRSEIVRATPIARENRNHALAEPREVEVWTGFDFPGRAGKYDPRTLNASHFVAVDHDSLDGHPQDAIFLFEGKSFAEGVDLELGNYDYLMGADVDHANPEVQQLLVDWGDWYVDLTGIDGLRLDAVKHMPAKVLHGYMAAMRAHAGRELAVVGEYWSPNLAALEYFLSESDEEIMLFDVPLHFRLQAASLAGAGYDLRAVFDETLVSIRPELAMTFVDNHDSQPLQALESAVESWFKPLAYALILLRRDGIPCVFVADYDGADYSEERGGQRVDVHLPAMRPLIDAMLAVRTELGEDAEQEDHFDSPNTIGWLRRRPGLVAVVVLGNGDAGSLRIGTGLPTATFHDATGHDAQSIVTDEDGSAQFRHPSGGVSVWVS